MNQFDISLEYAIFSKAYKEALELLKSDLRERVKNLKFVFERDNLTEQQLKKAYREEEYIKNIADYIQNSQTVISILMDELVNKHQIQIDWRDEYLREVETNQKFVETMIFKYNKLRRDGKGE